ncbi:unnamed protein product, partial [marine sediment metagenome]
MGKIVFNSNSEPTLGVELELGLVDGDSLGLASQINQVLAKLPTSGGDDDCFKPELLQSFIEVNTGICRTVG